MTDRSLRVWVSKADLKKDQWSSDCPLVSALNRKFNTQRSRYDLYGIQSCGCKLKITSTLPKALMPDGRVYAIPTKPGYVYLSLA